MVAQGGLRERKKQQTRRQLAAVAVDLFASRGFEHVTISDIAEASEVGGRTVFRYFTDKAELVFADDELVDEELRRALRELDADVQPWAAVTIALTQLSELWGTRREEGRQRRALIAGSATLTARHLVKLQHHAGVIAEELEERGASRESAHVIGRTAVAVFDCAVDNWLDDEQLAIEHALRQALEVLGELHSDGPSER